jgi:CRISPR-associated protein (TIGR02584 family)
MHAFRNVLVAVVGLTPQVIMETVYYLSQVHRPPVVLAAIHVLTTRRGEVGSFDLMKKGLRRPVIWCWSREG